MDLERSLKREQIHVEMLYLCPRKQLFINLKNIILINIYL